MSIVNACLNIIIQTDRYLRNAIISCTSAVTSRTIQNRDNQ